MGTTFVYFNYNKDEKDKTPICYHYRNDQSFAGVGIIADWIEKYDADFFSCVEFVDDRKELKFDRVDDQVEFLSRIKTVQTIIEKKYPNQVEIVGEFKITITDVFEYI